LQNGKVRAWGANWNGQSSVPTDLGACVAIATGGYHTVALTYSVAPSTSTSPELAPFSFALPRTFAITGIQATSTGATLTVTARGNLGTTTKFLTVKIDGVTLATNIFGAGSGAANCAATASTATFTIPPAQFASLTADGALEVRVEPSLNATSDGCANASLTVELNYTRDFYDCNGNGNDDGCDIVLGAVDENHNGKLDSCELAYGDLNLDGYVNGADLGGLLSLWGIQDPPYGDLDGNRQINGADLGVLLAHWGPVP
jgi:hypothetical protein